MGVGTNDALGVGAIVLGACGDCAGSVTGAWLGGTLLEGAGAMLVTIVYANTKAIRTITVAIASRPRIFALSFLAGYRSIRPSPKLIYWSVLAIASYSC